MLSFKDVRIVEEIYEFIFEKLQKADNSDAVREALGLEGETPNGKARERGPYKGGKLENVGFTARPNKLSHKSNEYRLRRIALNLTQRQLAKKAGVKLFQIVKLEHNGRPNSTDLDKIATALGMTELVPIPKRKTKVAYRPFDKDRWQKDARAQELARRLRDVRIRANLGQDSWAKKAGLGPNYVGAAERIDRLPTRAGLTRLFDVIGLPITILGDISWLPSEQVKNKPSA